LFISASEGVGKAGFSGNNGLIDCFKCVRDWYQGGSFIGDRKEFTLLAEQKVLNNPGEWI